MYFTWRSLVGGKETDLLVLEGKAHKQIIRDKQESTKASSGEEAVVESNELQIIKLL